MDLKLLNSFYRRCWTTQLWFVQVPLSTAQSHLRCHSSFYVLNVDVILRVWALLGHGELPSWLLKTLVRNTASCGILLMLFSLLGSGCNVGHRSSRTFGVVSLDDLRNFSRLRRSSSDGLLNDPFTAKRDWLFTYFLRSKAIPLVWWIRICLVVIRCSCILLLKHRS